MATDLVQKVVWLVTFSDAKRKLQHIVGGAHFGFVNMAAESSPGIHECLSEYEQQNGMEVGSVCRSIWPVGHQVVGLALIEPLAVQHSLLQLCPEMKAQYDFWSTLQDDLMESKLYYFRVVKAVMLSVPMSLQETRTGKHTFFFQLSPFWAARLWDKGVIGVGPREFASWMHFASGECPELALRLPKPVIYLLAAQHWTRASVPEAVPSMSLVAGWQTSRSALPVLETLLSLRDSFQRLPDHLHIWKYIDGCDSSEGTPLDMLQIMCSGLLQASPGEGNRKQLMSHLVSAAQVLQKQELEKRVFRLQAGSLGRARKYGAGRLVEFFWVAGLLQNDRELKAALRNACNVGLPQGAKEDSIEFIDGTSEGASMRIPSAATLSRCRLRIDVSWTLLFRKWVCSHLRQHGGAGVAVYVQTDATWQAKQEYQVTVLNIVKTDDLLQLHKDR